MSGSFKTVLLGLKYLHDATETLGGSVGILVFDFFVTIIFRVTGQISGLMNRKLS